MYWCRKTIIFDRVASKTFYSYVSVVVLATLFSLMQSICEGTIISGTLHRNAPTGEKYFLTTQFEEISARSCFPCWDEPAIKAPFHITLIVDSDKMALSNMPEESSNVNGPLKTVIFKESPPMSTYVVAFVVGHFDVIETTDQKIPIRFFTSPGKKNEATFAWELSKKVIPYFAQRFNTPYTLPKLDSVLVPDMYSTGMENFGLITYQEKQMLVNNTSTDAIKRNAASLVCHEISHMWMGNLVTLEWWNFYWLKEAVATFLEYYCTNDFYPNFDIWHTEYEPLYETHMNTDAFLETFPLERNLNTNTDIQNLLDKFIYVKGSAVMKMAFTFVGEKDFFSGLNLFFTEYAYKSATDSNFWEKIEKASSKPVSRVMPDWSKKSGYPLLFVEGTQEGGNRKFVISQQRFLQDPKEKDDKTIYTTPLMFFKKSNLKAVFFTAILDSQKTTVTISHVGADEWVILNYELTAWYRVRYSVETLKLISTGLNDKSIPYLSRLAIIDDFYSLILNGSGGTVELLELLKSMKEEDEATIWQELYTFFNPLVNIILVPDLVPHIHVYGIALMEPLKKKLGFNFIPTEASSINELRNYLLYLLLLFEDSEFIQYAVKMFEDNVSDVDKIPDNMRGLVYQAYLLTKGREAYNALLQVYKSRKTADAKHVLLYSFLTIKDLSVVDDMLAFSISKEVDATGTLIIIARLAYNPIARDKTWEFVKSNYDNLRKKFSTDSAITNLIANVVETYPDEKKIDEMKQFLTQKKLDVNDPSIGSAYITIRMYSAWCKADLDALMQYLRNIK